MEWRHPARPRPPSAPQSAPTLICALILLLVSLVRTDASIQTYTVGLLLQDESHIAAISDIFNDLNNSFDVGQSKIYLNATILVLNQNPIQAALDVCEILVPTGVYAIIVSQSNSQYTSPVTVSYTCSFYDIPLIGVSSREAILSNKNMHPMFMRTVPSVTEQTKVLLDIARYYHWYTVVAIVSNELDGKVIGNTLWIEGDERNVQVDLRRFDSQTTNITELLQQIINEQHWIMILHVSRTDAERIFQIAAKQLNMFTPGYVWLVTEDLLDVAPPGTIAPSLRHGSDQLTHIYDALRLFKTGMQSLSDGRRNISAPPTSCQELNRGWFHGKRIYKELLKTSMPARTGPLSFDASGNRLGSTYDIINTVELSGELRHVLIGDWSGNTELRISPDVEVNWPGDSIVTPIGYIVPDHLRVVTLETQPFLYVGKTKVMGNGECPPAYSPLRSDTESAFDMVTCDNPLALSNETGRVCCYGYCIDLLIALSQELNFTYDLRLSADQTFGIQKKTVREDGTIETDWNGMIGELLHEEADIIVAALTTDNERAQVIDFSNPFKHQGLSILVKKDKEDSNFASFIQPFDIKLWILIVISVHIVALVLYLLDRFSPFSQYRTEDGKDQDALNLSSAMWFAWGVLLNSGIGEGTPRSFSARVLGMVWAGFAMIIVASYTANLAAFLVLDRPETVLSGINDARMRNPTDKFKYGSVQDSFVEAYFKRKVELSNMYTFMRQYSFNTSAEAIDALINNKIQAFIWDSAVLDYVISNDCTLVTVGDLFYRSGFSVGLQKHSPWRDRISLAILGFHEDGFMEELDAKWIVHNQCDANTLQPSTLGLQSMVGVFLLVAGGIVAGIFLIFIEIAYKRHRAKQQKDRQLAQMVAEKWKVFTRNRKRKNRRPAHSRADMERVQRGPRDQEMISYTDINNTMTPMMLCSLTEAPPSLPPPCYDVNMV